jgi:Bacterial Ig-like domain (group 3)/NHL repeat
MGTQSITYHLCPRRGLRWVGLLIVALGSSLFATAQTSALTVPLILPSAVVFDSAGNLYIAETAKHIIRKVDTAGHTIVVAGTGVQGLSGDMGSATAATLDSPQGLAFDGANDLYIADTHNHRVRRLNLLTGIIDTTAGTAPGFSGDGGLASSAQLLLPVALAMDFKGNLYVADSGNHRIRRIDGATGIITTVAGTGSQGFSGDDAFATQASIDSPTGLALDAAGNIFLSDTHNHRIRRIDAATGIITTIAGTGSQTFTGDSIPATAAALALPRGISIDGNGDIYLADNANHRIRRIAADTGIITTIAGNGTQGFSGDSSPAVAASLDTPRSTALSAGSIVTLADAGNQRIRRLTAAPAPATNIETVAGFSPVNFSTLTLTAPSSVIYGAGQLTATLATATSAAGSVDFLDDNATIGSTSLTANAATFSIATLAAGDHKLTASYTGDQAHLSAHSNAITLSVTRAPTLITLTSSTDTSTTSFTFTAHVAATTGSTPTGSVALLGANTLFTAPLSETGDAVFTTPSLTQGLHTLTAFFSGSTNFAPSTSAPKLVTVVSGATPNPDFTLASTGPGTQTITSGSSATFTFAVQFQGAISSPVTLAASGLPNFATASFNPPILPPGNAASTFAMTITTPNGTAKNTPSTAYIRWAFLLCLTPVLCQRNRRAATKLVAIALTSVTLYCITGCGDRTNTTNAFLPPLKRYTIKVTGTATASTGDVLEHSVNVTLLLQPLQQN